MSLSDTLSGFGRKTSRIITLALFMGLGLTLSACQIRPLYATNPETGMKLSTELASIEIAPAKDRVEQEIRNNLIFAFTGGGNAGDPFYRLEMLTKHETSDLDIESGTGLAQTTRVILTVHYKMTNIADNRIITTGSSFFTASYAKSSQRYANYRALRDAEDRAAKQVANDIQLRLSSFFATGV